MKESFSAFANASLLLGFQWPAGLQQTSDSAGECGLLQCEHSLSSNCCHLCILTRGGQIALAMKRNLGPAESTTSRVSCSVAGWVSSSITKAIWPAGAWMPHHSGDSPIFCFGCTFGALCFSLQLPETLNVSVFQLWAVHQKKLNWGVLCTVL